MENQKVALMCEHKDCYNKFTIMKFDDNKNRYVRLCDFHK